MNFEASRAKALDKLNYFIENDLSKYSKLRRGDFVRTMGNPGGLIAHTAEGSIQYLGEIKDLGEEIVKKFNFDKNTKIIIHGAKIAEGSSGGPLFDKDGNLIGINTLSAPGTAAENISVSSDHIKELLRN